MDIAILLPLQVCIPLIIGAFLILVRNYNFSIIITLLTTLINLGISLLLVLFIYDYNSAIHYYFGNFAAPFGIEYKVDKLTAFILLIVSAMSFIAVLWGKTLIKEEMQAKAHIFNAVYLICVSGLSGIVITGDAFNLFVFLEISSLSTYILIAMGKNKQALVSAFNYLIVGTLGASFYVLGIGILYMLSGTLNIADIAQRLENIENINTTVLALTLITAGLALKMAVFPLFTWLPKAYRYSSATTSVFLAATATKVMIYVFLRIVVSTFSVFLGSKVLIILNIFLILGLCNIFIGSYLAIKQTDLKELLAYSSIAQIGYMIFAIALFSEMSIVAALLYLFNHALIKGMLFMAVGNYYLAFGTTNLRELAGKATQLPITFLALIVGALSLIGIPGTAGFISKWYLFSAIFSDGFWFFGVIIILSSLMSLLYVIKMLETLWFQNHDIVANTYTSAYNTVPKSIPLLMNLSVLALVILNIYFGLHADTLAKFAEQASQNILNTG